MDTEVKDTKEVEKGDKGISSKASSRAGSRRGSKKGSSKSKKRITSPNIKSPKSAGNDIQNGSS